MFESDNELDLGTSKQPSTLKNNEAQLIAELERQSLDEIKKLRAYERRETKVGVDLLPGNSSTRDEYRLTGKTNDISESGCSAVFPEAVLPGDVYRLVFDRESIDLPLVFARAMRCRMLREGSYEVGFRFFTPVKLPKTRSTESDLI